MQIAAVSSAATPLASSSATSASPTPSDAVAQMQQYASILSDSSTASDQDKINAYVGIMKNWGNVGGWFANSTADQRKAVVDAATTSSIAKQIQTATDQFNAAGWAADAKDAKTANGGVTAADSQYNRLNNLSPLEQQLVFAGTATLTQVQSLDDWKAQLKAEDASIIPGFSASLAASQPAVTVSLSDTAKAALTGSNTSSTNATGNTADSAAPDPTPPAAQALKALTSSSATSTIADAALTILQNAATAQATAKVADATSNTTSSSTPSTTQAPATQKTYAVGSKLDSVA